jgi:hypothetical protein
MRGLRFVSALLCLWALLPGPAAADEATDAFHAAVAGAYRSYREAVHYHETGNVDLAELALDEFVAAWKAVEARYAGKPPPAYAKDAAFAETLAAIGGKAASAVGAAPAEALFALRPIRADLAALRKRNSQTVFSDCVDAMNAAMDRLWAYRQKPPGAKEVPAFKAAVQAATAQYRRCLDEAPAPLRDAAEFRRLLEGALASFARLEAAGEAVNAELVVSLLRELRSFDKLIWLRFG